jgi:CRP-like cAMP-binding protein
MSKPQRPVNNRLLHALPIEEYKRLLPILETIELSQDQVLCEPEKNFYSVYFPVTAVISIISVVDIDKSVEVALIGREGMIGIPAAFGKRKVPYRAITQIPGEVASVPVNVFQQAVERSGALGQLLFRYTTALLMQMVQSVGCNRIHKLGQRLCRLLLENIDRVKTNRLPYTHEFLAFMLAAERSNISKSLGSLEKAGIIHHNRAEVTIIDPVGLEDRSCECYRIIKDEFDKFLGQ